MKITTVEQVEDMKYSVLAAAKLGNVSINDYNFWEIREKARILSGEYQGLSLVGDDPYRFLHVSVDDSSRVAYTKSFDKGKQDIQTVTSLEAYCDKFGLVFPENPAPFPEPTGHQESQLRRTITQYFDTLHTLDSIKKELKAML